MPPGGSVGVGTIGESVSESMTGGDVCNLGGADENVGVFTGTRLSSSEGGSVFSSPKGCELPFGYCVRAGFGSSVPRGMAEIKFLGESVAGICEKLDSGESELLVGEGDQSSVGSELLCTIVGSTVREGWDVTGVNIGGSMVGTDGFGANVFPVWSPEGSIDPPAVGTIIFFCGETVGRLSVPEDGSNTPMGTDDGVDVLVDLVGSIVSTCCGAPERNLLFSPEGSCVWLDGVLLGAGKVSTVDGSFVLSEMEVGSSDFSTADLVGAGLESSFGVFVGSSKGFMVMLNKTEGSIEGPDTVGA